MARPDFIEARRRADTFAVLVAHDMRSGSFEQASRNVVRHAKECRLDPWRALRLSYTREFVDRVADLANK